MVGAKQLPAVILKLWHQWYTSAGATEALMVMWHCGILYRDAERGSDDGKLLNLYVWHIVERFVYFTSL